MCPRRRSGGVGQRVLFPSLPHSLVTEGGRGLSTPLGPLATWPLCKERGPGTGHWAKPLPACYVHSPSGTTLCLWVQGWTPLRVVSMGGGWKCAEI